MNEPQLNRITGILFLAGAVIVNLPYALLITSFNYPDILREPPGVILTRFDGGGTALIYTWLAFAWSGLPLLVAIVLLQKVVARGNTPYILVGTVAGVLGAAAQMIGLLRWVFVVPVLATAYTEAAASPSTKDAVVVVFKAVHQYGGVVLGEHIGQLFTILWMISVCLSLLQTSFVSRWIAWFGLAAAAIYLLAQGELLATVVPGLTAVPEAGLVGSLLWLGWMAVLGVALIRRSRVMGSAIELP